MKQPPALLTAPWLISESGAALVWGVWSRGELFGDVLERARAERPGPYANDPGRLTRSGDVAIVPVTGPIFRKASLFTDLSSATSDEMIRAALADAVADPSVQAIVLDVDSPGGEAAGAAETAAAIRAADSAKPVVAYVGGTSASKAYWFTSAARAIVMARDAHVGSIGARVTLIDESEQEAQHGIRTREIVSEISPQKRSHPIDDAVVASVQRTIDGIAAVFADEVATGRKVSLATVIRDFGRGGVVIGEQAVRAGMADEIGTLGAAIARARGEATKRQGATMSQQINPAAQAGPPAAAGTCDGCGAAGESKHYCHGCRSAGVAAQAAIARVMALAGEQTADGAIGVLTHWRDEAQAAKGLRERLESHEASARAGRFAAQLTSAVEAGGLTVADLTATLPALLDGENAARATAAIDGLPPDLGGNGPALVRAITGAVQVGDGEARRIEAYLARKSRIRAPLPAVQAAPARSHQRDSDGIDPARAAMIDRAMGITTTPAA